MDVSTVCFNMAKDLNELLDRLAEKHQELIDPESIREARNGNWGQLAEFVLMLRVDDASKEDLILAQELCEYLVENGHPQYKSDRDEIAHSLNPSLPYSVEDVKAYLALCRQGKSEVFGLLVKAIQSDTALFHRFKTQVAQTYKCLQRKDELYENDLHVWNALLTLDPRSKSSAIEIDDALFDLQCGIDKDSDPYIAVAYLDYISHLGVQARLDADYKEALANIVIHGKDADIAFYQGLDALFQADYGSVYVSFCKSEDKRCRLAQAYCLIHGIGTEVNHEAGRAILKDYPEDGFALFLLAVSLFRTNPDKTVLPAEVTELLDEAYRLGYRPAGDTKVLMDLYCRNQSKAASTVDCGSMEIEMSAKGHESNGGICFVSYLYCLGKLRGMGLYENMDEDFFLSEEHRRFVDTMLEIGTNDPTPLAAVSIAMFQRNATEYPETDMWEKALHGLYQSPLARRYTLDRAVVERLLEGVGNIETLLEYLIHMGVDDQQLMLWSAALNISKSFKQEKLGKALDRGFCQLFASQADCPLVKLLIAYFREETSEDKDCPFIKEAFSETVDVRDNMVVLLRNKLIERYDLDEEFPIQKDGLLLDEFDHNLLYQYIGYSFFDY